MKLSPTLFLVLAAGGFLPGCSSLISTSDSGASAVGKGYVRIAPRMSISYQGLVQGGLAAAAIYLVYDPLAPNWEIEEARLTDDTFQFSLKMKRYNTGGSGESMQVLRRRVATLQRELGFGGFQLMEYSEGIESETLGARRVANGTVRLTQKLAAADLPALREPAAVPAQAKAACANSFLQDDC